MKTLLIDNYDSFTYNLFQLLAEVNGCDPIVIQNDSHSWEEILKLEFDNIVISPGPGHPGNPSDFGVCSEVIRNSKVPLLGVCLGHQGLALAYGAQIQKAPEPIHGRTSQVRHDQHELFSQIPDLFSVVRYHSLIVETDLPEELQVIAQTENGLVMAIAHKSRPQLGIQFHPESVLTDYGRQILENFKGISSKFIGNLPSPKLTTTPNSDQTKKIHLRTPKESWKLGYKRLELCPSSEVLFSKAFASSNKAFWLDSSSVRPGYSRFSYLGDASGPLAEFLSYSEGRRELIIESDDKTQALKVDSVFDYLKVQLESRKIDPEAQLPFDFQGGYVGYLGYELHRELLPNQPQGQKSQLPESQWIFADQVVILDHQENQTFLIYLYKTQSDLQDQLLWLDEMQKTIHNLHLEKELKMPEAGLSLHSPTLPRIEKTDFLKKIRKAKDLIAIGESYEICLTNELTVVSAAKPLVTYHYLRKVNAAPYGAYLQLGEMQILSSSPERFMKVSPGGHIETKPIKGTAPRGSSPTEDLLLKSQLQKSEKDRAENLMIVDLLRNDLGRVSEVGSVRVDKLMDIESYSTVHQMVSTISGQLRRELSAMDAVRAAFPGGSMTGAPKKRTIEILESLEEGSRGVYAGALGYLSLSGTVDLSIVIRTLIHKSGKYSLGTGGAITALSDPNAEYEEAQLKAKAPLFALAQAEQFCSDNFSTDAIKAPPEVGLI